MWTREEINEACDRYHEKKTGQKTITVRLIGISKSQSFTCTLLTDDNIFWASNGLGKIQFNTIWKKYQWDWHNPKYARIRYDHFANDGTPVNAKVVSTGLMSELNIL